MLDKATGKLVAVDKSLNNDWDEFEDKLDELEECDNTLGGSKAILKNMGYSDTLTNRVLRQS